MILELLHWDIGGKLTLWEEIEENLRCVANTSLIFAVTRPEFLGSPLATGESGAVTSVPSQVYISRGFHCIASIDDPNE